MHPHKAKWTLTFLALFFCLHLADTTSRAKATEKETIAIITATPKQSWKQHDIAQKVVQSMSKNTDRDILHIAYENGVKTSMDLTKSSAAPVLENPRITLLIVGDGVKDKAHLIKLIKNERPDLLIFSLQHSPTETPTLADITVIPDYAVQGYAIPLAAKEMGAKALIHLSFSPSDESTADKLRFEVEQATCKALGMPLIRESFADAVKENENGQHRIVSRKISDLIKKHGTGAAFFCAEPPLSSNAVREIAKYRGYFINGNLFSPLDPLKNALQLKNNDDYDETPAEIKNVEKSIIRTGNKGKEGSPLSSFDYVALQALVHFGELVLKKQASPSNATELQQSLEHVAPQSKWNVTPHSTKRAEHVYLIHQDYYIFGKGFMRSLNMQKIPAYVESLRSDSF